LLARAQLEPHPETGMNRLSIPHDALVFVGDGQKALFLRNAGDATLLNLTTEHVFTDENPPTHEQGTDRPGRTFQSAAKNKRSGLETTDWHELEKERFARRVAAALEQMVRSEKVKTIVVVAPPRTLAELQYRLSCGRKKPDSRRNRQGSDQASGGPDRETSRSLTKSGDLSAGNVLFEKVGMLQTGELDGKAIFQVAHHAPLDLA
jgi:protein required for attachment to host cells